MENREKCVMCGVDTPYDKSTHVDHRYNYVDGLGQMCTQCYREATNPKEHILIPKEYVHMYPNDMELGQVVRQFYNQQYN